MSDRSIDAQVAELLEPKPATQEVDHAQSAKGWWSAQPDQAWTAIEWVPTYRPSIDLNAALRAYDEFHKQRGWIVDEITQNPAGDWWCFLSAAMKGRVCRRRATLAESICAALIAASERT